MSMGSKCYWVHPSLEQSRSRETDGVSIDYACAERRNRLWCFDIFCKDMTDNAGVERHLDDFGRRRIVCNQLQSLIDCKHRIWGLAVPARRASIWIIRLRRPVF